MQVPVSVGFQKDKDGTSESDVEEGLVERQAADDIRIPVDAPPKIIGHSQVDDVAQDGKQESKAVDHAHHEGAAGDGDIGPHPSAPS